LSAWRHSFRDRIGYGDYAAGRAAPLPEATVERLRAEGAG
jgi:hypothetical protein